MTRVTRLPGDHSQVGWLPPSSVPYHYSEKDSSPLTRGKLAARQRRVPQAGFIPAHAGKTRWLRARSPPKRAHSRSRGENVDWFRSYLLPVGSSPLTQGKRCPDSIPGGPQGSSPLTRGKRRRFREWPGRTRLIPAHAGKTRQCPPWFPDRTAHPRSRGENLVDSLYGVLRAGSSPLTRGKHISARLDALDEGLIPAHAGKTRPSSDSSPDHRAHPRSRGENASRDAHNSEPTGSSPLTRGKLPGKNDSCAGAGLIPAHAGKT